MKDTAISYDIVHQQQQQQQQQQQHQAQQHSWTQQQQRQHQTHTTSVYSSQANQRSTIDQQHATAQLNQYHQQQQPQLQSTPHHNSSAASPYYQQAAHLYPTYQHGHSQDQQQHSTNSDNQHGQHHHHSVSGTGPSSIVNTGVVGSTTTNQHLHHPQTVNNTQNSTLNHASWSTPGVGSIPPPAHHAVVTDPSTLAYITHGYQSHNTSLNEHHRNTQTIGTGPQGSTYTVDSLYNTPGAAAAAAAVVAAYGYNNYNAPFFQTSNNNPHSQTGHPQQANISNFWNHGQTGTQQQPQQERGTHSQVTNQASIQHRQPIVSQQAPTSANYMHDPRIYYGRPTYGQGLQDFGQSQGQAQTDVLHQRMSAALTQQQLLQHHEQSLHQVATQNQQHHLQQHQQPHGALITNSQHHLTELSNQSSQTTVQPIVRQQSGQLTSDPMNSSTTVPQSKVQQLNLEPQQKQNVIETDSMVQRHPQLDLTKSPTLKNTTTQNMKPKSPIMDPKASLPIIKQNSPIIANTIQNTTQQQTAAITETPLIKQTPISSRNVIKNEPTTHYQRKQLDTSQAPARNQYLRDNHESRLKSQTSDLTMNKKPTINNESIEIKSVPESKNHSSEPITKQQELNNQTVSIEESLASLALSDNSPKKTTWASIASQPAKVSQPKSLKSKIAGSNSVLSSAKHLAAVSLDSTSLETKNGINPAIKNSVSSAATSIQTRSSLPPTISKLPAVAASLKLDLLGKDCSESTKISWPAVNASINLKLDDPPKQKETSTDSEINLLGELQDKQKRDSDTYRNRSDRNNMHNEINQHQMSNSNNINSYNNSGVREPFWNRRDQHRVERTRRDSDRKDSDRDHQDESREFGYNRRGIDGNRSNGMGSGGRVNFFRNDDQFRERDYGSNKFRGPVNSLHNERNEQRNNDNYQNSRFQNNRFEQRIPHQHNGNRHNSQNNDNNQQTQHHHYNNVRDGNTAGSSLSKQDLSLYPQLDPANFNPKSFNLEPESARYFIIKSYSEDDIHRSIKYSIWCSTNHGNKRLDDAYKQQQQQTKDGQIYLFFSVNGSGHFCGMAQMVSPVDFDSSSGVWAQSKWQGKFSVKWIYVKDVPNNALRHITLENNEDKPVTNSRDTQEVPSEKGKAVLKIIHQYQHTTSLFDDFLHYERRQEEEKMKKNSILDQPSNNRPFDDRGSGRGSNGRPYTNERSNYSRPHNDFQNIRDRSSRFAS